ncbi:hypothetical protein KKI24_10925 [bacterium]|nr:hypothetical protein [bacterium]
MLIVLLIQGVEFVEVEVRTYDSPDMEKLDFLQLNDWGRVSLLSLGFLVLLCLRLITGPDGKWIKQVIRTLNPKVTGWDHRKYAAYILGVAEKQGYTAIDCFCLWLRIRDQLGVDAADSFEAYSNIVSRRKIEKWMRDNGFGADKKTVINERAMKRLEVLYRLPPVPFEYRQRLSRDQFDHALRFIRACERLFEWERIDTMEIGIKDFQARLKTIREIVRCCGDRRLLELIDTALQSRQQGFVELVTLFADWNIVENAYLLQWKGTKKNGLIT